MNKIIAFILGLVGLFSSCQTDETISPHVTNALVIGIGYDCGSSYLIQFDEDVPDLPPNSWDNTFYEINLPDEYKIADERIYCEFRLPDDDEYMLCTHLGPGFPEIYIISVNE